MFAAGPDDPLLALREVQALVPACKPDIHLFSPRLKPTLAFEILRDARVLYEAEPRQGALSLVELATLVEPPLPPFKHFAFVRPI